MKQGKKRAFTLIEFLIIITIIGLLSTVIISQVRKGIDQARHAAVQEGFFLMRQTMLNYFFERGDYGTIQVSGDTCAGGMFNDENYTRIRLHVLQISNGTELCSVGPGGQSFAYSVVSATHGTVCIDQVTIYSDKTAQGGGGTEAQCQ